MTEEKLPPRPSIATLLRAKLPSKAADDATKAELAAESAPAEERDTAAEERPDAATSAATDDMVAQTSSTPLDVEPADEEQPADEAGAVPSVEPQSWSNDLAAAPQTEPRSPINVTEVTLQSVRRSNAPAPSFLGGHRTTPVQVNTPRWQWIAIGVLAIVLLLQILIADRAHLASDAGWRPLLTRMCSILRCDLPPWREPQAFTMLTRDVRPVSRHAGILQVQASFRNDARWAQAWPMLQLSLSDADGRVIGSRVFAPADYLGRTPATDEAIAPGQSTQIAFRVHEPSASTAAFTFEFR